MLSSDIFVVDDERVIGQTLGIILRQAGYRVEVFHDPLVALQRSHCPPRLILTDQTMPAISGTLLATKFLAVNPALAVIVFSGNLMETDIEWKALRRLSASSRLLHKPLHPTQLLTAVREAIGPAQPDFIPSLRGLVGGTPSPHPALLHRVMQSLRGTAMMVR